MKTEIENKLKGLRKEAYIILNFKWFIDDNRKKINGLTVAEIIKNFLADEESYILTDFEDRDSIIFNLKALGEDKIMDSTFITETVSKLDKVVNTLTIEIKDLDLQLDIIEFGEDFS